MPTTVELAVDWETKCRKVERTLANLRDKQERTQRENSALRDLLDRANVRMDELKQPPVGIVQVSREALHSVLTALIGAPHLIRELQATRLPEELFQDNPINTLIRAYQEQPR